MTDKHLQERNTFFDLMCYKRVSNSAKLNTYYKSTSNVHEKKSDKIIFQSPNPEFEIAMCMHKIWAKAIEFSYYGKRYYNTEAYQDVVQVYPDKFKSVSNFVITEFVDDLIKTCMAIPAGIKEILEDGTELYYKPFELFIDDDEVRYYIYPNKQAKDFYYRNNIEPKDITDAIWSIGVTEKLIDRGEFKEAIKKLDSYFRFIKDEQEDIDSIFRSAQYNPEIIVNFNFTHRLNNDIREISEAKNLSSSWHRIFELEPDSSWGENKKTDFYVLQQKITEYPHYNNNFVQFLKKSTEKCKQMRIDYLKNSYKKSSAKNIVKMKNNLCLHPINQSIDNIVDFIQVLLFRPEECRSIGFPLREHSINDLTKEISEETDEDIFDKTDINEDFLSIKKEYFFNMYNSISEISFSSENEKIKLSDYFKALHDNNFEYYKEIVTQPNFIRSFFTGVYNSNHIFVFNENKTNDLFSIYDLNMERLDETFTIPILYDETRAMFTKKLEIQDYILSNKKESLNGN